jgi:hypothetical protein
MALIGVFAFLAGCSSVNVVTDITDVKPGGPISGAPFRLAEEYRVSLYQLKKDGSYERVFQQRNSMPDQTKVFAAGYTAQSLSDHTFKVDLYDDNTLKMTSITSTQKINAAAGALADEVIANRTARDALVASEKKNVSGQRILESTALELKGKADIALAQLDAVLAKADATELEKVTAQAALDLARNKANIAAIEAGLAAPFP